MALVSPGLHSLNSKPTKGAVRRKGGKYTFVISVLNPDWSSFHSNKVICYQQFHFSSWNNPRGRKKSNILCKILTLIKACFALWYWIEASQRPAVNLTTFSMLAFLGTVTRVTRHSEGWEGFPLPLWCLDWSPDLPPSGEIIITCRSCGKGSS